MIFQVPVTVIDSYFYGRLVVAPLNIVLYNIFSNHGPDLYGTSPWSFYFLNGFLNFNAIFPLALISLPSLFITWKLNLFRRKSVAVLLALLPLYTWIIIFFTQPHKVITNLLKFKSNDNLMVLYRKELSSGRSLNFA